LGVTNYSPQQVLSAIFQFSGATTDIVIANLRIPRAIYAPLVGAALGVSGLLLQSITKNPLASPGFLGINAGASFAVVVGVSVFGVGAYWAIALLAAGGAFAAALTVLSIAMRLGGRFTPAILLLAGVALATFLSSINMMLLLVDEATMQSLLFWMSGGFADRDPTFLTLAAPIILLCILAAVLLSNQLDALQTDDDSARALGVSVEHTRYFAILVAAILAGTAVSLAGPVAFVGLIAPHIAKALFQMRHISLIIASALIGGIITTTADILVRFVIYPSEAPLGAVMALFGVPALLVILQPKSKRHGGQHG
jgi:iron complex transport system permease protein